MALTLSRKKWELSDLLELQRGYFPDDEVTPRKKIFWLDATVTTVAPSFLTFFQRRGFDLTLFQEITPALTFFEEHFPDAGIIDLDLEPTTGLDLLETMKNDSYFHDFPLILTSAHPEEKFVVEQNIVKIFGGVKLLKKPLTSQTLITELTALFDGANQ